MYQLQFDLKNIDEIRDVNLFGRYLHISSTIDKKSLNELISQQNYKGLEFKQIKAGIEDVFIYLMTNRERRSHEQ